MSRKLINSPKSCWCDLGLLASCTYVAFVLWPKPWYVRSQLPGERFSLNSYFGHPCTHILRHPLINPLITCLSVCLSVSIPPQLWKQALAQSGTLLINSTHIPGAGPHQRANLRCKGNCWMQPYECWGRAGNRFCWGGGLAVSTTILVSQYTCEDYISCVKFLTNVMLATVFEHCCYSFIQYWFH